MSFNFEKIKAKRESGGNEWTSYSDLFMVLAFVFLLLYVVANLRSGSMSVSQQRELQDAKEQIEEAKQLARVYEVLKDNYLEQQASPQDIKMYKELMENLKLVRDESEEKRKEVYQQYRQAKKEEEQLNRYQKMVKNILTANLAARSKLRTRDEIIQDKEENIEELSETVQEKEAVISQNNEEIQNIQKELERSIQEIKFAYKSKERSKKQLQKKIAALREASEQRIKALQSMNSEVEQELTQAKTMIEEKSKVVEKKEEEITSLQGSLSQKQVAIQKLKGSIQERESNIKKLSNELDTREKNIQALQGDLKVREQGIQRLQEEVQKKERDVKQKESQIAELNQNIAGLKSDYSSRMQQEKMAFEESLKKEKLSAAARIEREKKFRSQMEEEAKAYSMKLNEMQSTLSQVSESAERVKGEFEREKAARAQAEQEAEQRAEKLAKLSGDLEGAQKEIEQTKGALKSAQYKANAKKRLANRLKRALSKSGLKADIDGETGEVTIHFGEEYFDTGSSKLKKGMRDIIEKLVPVYAESLFSDQKLAKKINSVEIVGFSSPTYNGKYVDPNSLKDEDRKAVSYNLDLSYSRAKGIFNHVFDTKKMKFSEQKRLQSLVKVSGRSFFAAKKVKTKDGRDPSSVTMDEYCTQFDCRTFQKVILKFDLN